MERLNTIKPLQIKEDEQGNKLVLLAEEDYLFLREKAKQAQELEQYIQRFELMEEQEYKKISAQNYHYREAIIEAMDIGLYGDSESGIMTMYKILNDALGES